MKRVDTGDRERSRLDVRASEGLYVITVCGAANQRAIGRNVDEDRCDLEQCIRGAIETTGLDIDDDRQES
ncbi:MAG: hypothetical protein RL321_1236, partial [Pseudomonadota bacterium]